MHVSPGGIHTSSAHTVSITLLLTPGQTPQPPTIDPAGTHVYIDPMTFNLALEARVKFKFSNLQHILVYS